VTLNATRASCARGREFVFQRPAKSYIALQTIRHGFNIYASSCVALALWCGDGHRQLVTRFGVMLFHFAPVIICLQPGLLSPHAGVSRFLQSIWLWNITKQFWSIW